MRWKSGRRSTNIEDRRGSSSGRRRGPAMAGGIGGIGAIIIIALAMFTDIDLTSMLQSGGTDTGSYTQSESTSQGEYTPTAEEQEMGDFVAAVLGDVEDTWNQLFREVGRTYQEPTLVLFSGSVQSACGYAGSSTGPFYCPGDKKVYLDTTFFDELARLGGSGDFAQAYVIAHEVGHHVQNLLGTLGEVQSLQQRVGRTEANELSVRLELQADCYAGVWGYHADRARNMLERGDLQEALNAASAIGDDRLQQQYQGQVVPDSFTHGTSEQRARWFRRGFDSGRMDACDTFNVSNL
ncbi:MAG: flagellar biosynthesis protein FlgM [Desulfovibrio sp.]|nr:MAG: flagellar biosynthesis protein FlgM [Desulfovibrio sp.]